MSKNIITIDKCTQTEYIQPMLTFSDRLTNDEIAIFLEDYKRLSTIYDLKVGLFVRYFIQSPTNINSLLFRTGGEIMSVSNLPEYITLKSGCTLWNVNIKNTIIFVKMSNDELKKEFADILFEKNERIKQLLQQYEFMKTKFEKLNNVSPKQNEIIKRNKIEQHEKRKQIEQQIFKIIKI